MVRLSLIALEWMWAGFVTAHNFPLVDHDVPEALHVDLHSSYSTSKLQRRDSNTVQIAAGYSVSNRRQPIIAGKKYDVAGIKSHFYSAGWTIPQHLHWYTSPATGRHYRYTGFRAGHTH